MVQCSFVIRLLMPTVEMNNYLWPNRSKGPLFHVWTTNVKVSIVHQWSDYGFHGPLTVYRITGYFKLYWQKTNQNPKTKALIRLRPWSDVLLFAIWTFFSSISWFSHIQMYNIVPDQKGIYSVFNIIWKHIFMWDLLYIFIICNKL